MAGSNDREWPWTEDSLLAGVADSASVVAALIRGPSDATGVLRLSAGHLQLAGWWLPPASEDSLYYITSTDTPDDPAGGPTREVSAAHDLYVPAEAERAATEAAWASIARDVWDWDQEQEAGGEWAWETVRVFLDHAEGFLAGSPGSPTDVTLPSEFVLGKFFFDALREAYAARPAFRA